MNLMGILKKSYKMCTEANKCEYIELTIFYVTNVEICNLMVFIEFIQWSNYYVENIS